MSKDIVKSKEYQDFIVALVGKIKQTRQNVYQTANRQLVELYWYIGKSVYEKIEVAKWGEGIVEKMSGDLHMRLPDMKGFSGQNLWRMKQMYETYKDNSKLSTLLRELSWSSHLHIISKTKTIEEKEFYLRLTVQEKYSVRELERQIDSGLFERVVLSMEKVPTSLTQKHPNAPEVFKDVYILDFLNLSEAHSENDLSKGIVSNLKNFILEFGKDFAFVGQEYRIQVGKNDYFIDLLFFHRGLRCLVMFELKIDDFKPEYLGKLNFYLEALNRDIRKPDENPSVGIILCKSKDDEVVEYALSRNLSPAMIAEYKIKLIPKKVLQEKLHEYYLLGESSAMKER